MNNDLRAFRGITIAVIIGGLIWVVAIACGGGSSNGPDTVKEVFPEEAQEPICPEYETNKICDLLERKKKLGLEGELIRDGITFDSCGVSTQWQVNADADRFILLDRVYCEGEFLEIVWLDMLDCFYQNRYKDSRLANLNLGELDEIPPPVFGILEDINIAVRDRKQCKRGCFDWDEILAREAYCFDVQLLKHEMTHVLLCWLTGNCDNNDRSDTNNIAHSTIWFKQNICINHSFGE